MATERQTNFLGGELSQYLWGRTDLPVFRTGLRKCRNFFISRAGALVSRPGTKLCLTPSGAVLKTKYAGSADPAQRTVRLVPFIYSDTDSVVLEMGEQYVRFVRRGVQVESAPGVPLELATPYASYELGQLQWAQSGNVMTFTHVDHPAQQLTRLTGSTWTWGAVAFAPPTTIHSPVWVNPTATFITDPPVLQTPLPVADADHPALSWIWLVSALRQSVANGGTYETQPYAISADDSGAAVPDLTAVYADRAVTVVRALTAFPTTALSGEDPVLAYLYYRGRGGDVFRGGRGGLYGYLGQGSGLTFVDVGDLPNYAIQPRWGINPFETLDFSGAVTRTDNPTAVAYFQDRLVFGVGSRVLFSATGEYQNFDLRDVVHVETEALDFTLAARKREDIRSFLPINKLMVFTQSSAWSGLLQPLNLDIHVEIGVGATTLPALSAGTAAIFVRNKGTGVHAVKPAESRVGFDGDDISTVSQHLFTGLSILDWCYAEDPWGVVWLVRNDGKLLSLTYDANTGTAAWAIHDVDTDSDVDTGYGAWSAVTSVPESNQDAVYLVRQIPGSFFNGGTIERMCSRQRLGAADDDDDNISVDSSLTVMAPVSSTVITGLGQFEGRNVYVVGPLNPVQGPYEVTDGGLTLDVPPIANMPGDIARLHIGLKYTPQVETLDYAPPELRTSQKTVREVGFEVDETRGMSAGPDFAHLEPVQERDVADSYGATGLQTQQQRKYISGGYADTGRAVLRQTQPLAVTIVGLTRELDVGGK